MNKHFEPQQHKFFIVWIPVEGDFAKALDYKGPWGSLPFFITPTLGPAPHEGGNYDMWQLQQDIVYCWDKEPQGATNVRKDLRRKILQRLGQQRGGHGLDGTVGEVNGHMLDMIGFDAGISCAINGLEICEGDLNYPRLFINTAIAYTPMLSETNAKFVLRAILSAASRLTKENSTQADFEIALAAQAAALAVLGDKKYLSDFCANILSTHNFTNQDFSDFTTDICVQPSAPLHGTFIRLAKLMRSTLGIRGVLA